MKREFLDYIEDIIEAMEDAITFLKDSHVQCFIECIYACSIKVVERHNAMCKNY